MIDTIENALALVNTVPLLSIWRRVSQIGGMMETETPIFDELWQELAARATAKHDEYYALGNVVYRLDEGYAEGALF